MLKENISHTPFDQFSQNDRPDLGSDIYATPVNGDGAALPDLRITSLSDLVVMTEFVTEAPATAGESDVGMDPKCSAENGQCVLY